MDFWMDFAWVRELLLQSYKNSFVKRITTLKKSEHCDSLGIILNKMAVVFAHHKRLWKAMLLNSKCP